eukprot:scaffold16612_cov109-Skeletonema_dohrnii-CCMP3373.AAC.2
MPTPMKEVPPLAAIMVEEEQCSGASSLANANKSNNEAWTCSCNMQWPSTQKRCGNTKCNKWKGGKRDGFIVHRPNVPSSSIASAPTITTTKQRPQDPSTAASAVQQQANTIDCWTCDNCQNIVKANKVRCGQCHHWKGGKRTTVKKKTTAKNDSGNDDNNGGSLLPSSSSAAAVGNNGGGGTANKASYPFDITQDWTCNNCSVTLPGRQTRCGKCHKWRGGKRQGGWTLKAKSTKGGQAEEEDGIDRTLDWTCCEVVLPARQTRCGKCHKWRGGKRVFAGNNGGNSKKKKSKKESNKKAKVVVSDNGLKENGNQMEAPSVHQHHSLANDKADNIVFEYPMPCAPAAAALYHPMPAISSTAGYLPLPSPITKAAAEVFMNSAEI